ncbi:MAG: phosphatase PAP2 family protein [Bacteroidetes bacterium]|nr:phosphatase PAP2 family protein [Bacteroidota bacterium]
MKTLTRFLFITICSVTIITIIPQSLKAEQIGDWSIIQQVDALFLPNELNAPLASLSTLTAGISLTLPILPISESLFSVEVPAESDILLSAYQTAMYAGSMGLVYISTELMKKSFSRRRPFPDESEDPNKSFPSRHTALSFAAATFQSIYLKNNDNSAATAVSVNISSWSLAILTGYLRAASGEHFITDVLAGAVIGSLIGAAGGILASL